MSDEAIPCVHPHDYLCAHVRKRRTARDRILAHVPAHGDPSRPERRERPGHRHSGVELLRRRQCLFIPLARPGRNGVCRVLRYHALCVHLIRKPRVELCGGSGHGVLPGDRQRGTGFHRFRRLYAVCDRLRGRAFLELRDGRVYHFLSRHRGGREHIRRLDRLSCVCVYLGRGACVELRNGRYG